MTLQATGEIERIGGRYQRLYVPTRLSTDSQFPFRPGDGVRFSLVETTCDRQVLVVTSDALEVDPDQTAVEIRRSTNEIQTSLEDAGGRA